MEGNEHRTVTPLVAAFLIGCVEDSADSFVAELEASRGASYSVEDIERFNLGTAESLTQLGDPNPNRLEIATD